MPPDLAGPVEVELARLTEHIPAPASMPGGARYEPKFDGYRAVVVRSEAGARIWSRQRHDLSDRFPDIAAAAERQLAPGVVLDGELTMLVEGRLSFDALQRRMVTSPSKAHALVKSVPAAFVAFDLLAVGGVDLRTQRWTVRRGRLEQLADRWRPPLQISPVTDDLAEAQEWFDVLPEAMGIEGLVVKAANSRYVPGRREWLKVKRRDSVEVIVGGVIGPIDRPEVVIAGRYRAGEFVMVGRTVPLGAADSRQLGAVLRPASRGHPWPDEIASVRWGGKDSKKPLTKVRPDVVVEVLADAAMQAGQWRHGLRYVRYRADLKPEEVPTL
ncbi:ATP-dependent DNA ligase [Kribbella italica]|uniref:ATP-dependent DNA ligase n=1 Tax=Kribbella italica TaxID=1540520 RepID=A0A7W9JEW3_9ACTN|nr:ATP-dependent DNA ligase [Kribbella italica]MBB5840208.1 ATP-dependent DNA ligase [Kribbella italica]